MLSEAINYPRESDHMLKTVLIGGVLSLLSVLVIPALILGGYMIRVLRHTTTGDDELPQFGDWGKLTLDGLKAIVIGIAYLLIPMALFALSISVLSGTLQMLGLVVSAIAYLAAIYCLPAATTVFAREERLGAAFTMSEIRSIATNRRYFGGWLRAVAISVVGGIVVGALGLIPILGFVVGVFIAFYVNLVTAYLFGHAVANAAIVTDPRKEQPITRPVA